MTNFIQKSGFTLAELLIALAILGVIATFTIPKILDSGSNSKHNSIAKEAAAIITEARQLVQLNNGITASTSFDEFTPYINYVRVNTTKLIDSANTLGSWSCSAGVRTCLDLHNGATLMYPNTTNFGDTTTTSSMYFYLDPDGQYSSSTTGPSKSVLFYIYYNGLIRSRGTILSGTRQGNDGNTYNPLPSLEPEYFSWGD